MTVILNSCNEANQNNGKIHITTPEESLQDDGFSAILHTQRNKVLLEGEVSKAKLRHENADYKAEIMQILADKDIIQAELKVYQSNLDSVKEYFKFREDVTIRQFEPISSPLCDNKMGLGWHWVGFLTTNQETCYAIKYSGIYLEDNLAVDDYYIRLDKNPFITNKYNVLLSKETDYAKLVQSGDFFRICSPSAEKKLLEYLKLKKYQNFPLSVQKNIKEK